MTPETKPNRQNPILQTLKRTIGFEAYQQNQKETAGDLWRGRINRVGNNVAFGISQLAFPIMTEAIVKTAEEPTLLRKNNVIMAITMLLDMGVTIGSIIMAMNMNLQPLAVAGKIGYNLGVGALNESLERAKVREKQI